MKYMDKINIKNSENILFDIYPSDKETYEIKYDDFNYDQETKDIPDNVIVRISDGKTYPRST